jgi:hypothetical protein
MLDTIKDILIGTKPCPKMLARKRDRILPSLGSQDYLELHRTINEQIRREQELIQQRITWILTFQGFLFASYGVALQATNNNKIVAADFLQALPIAGLVTAFSVLVGVLAAFRQVNAHKREWLAYEQEILLKAVKPFSDFWGSVSGRIPILAVPICIIYTWCKLL